MSITDSICGSSASLRTPKTVRRSSRRLKLIGILRRREESTLSEVGFDKRQSELLDISQNANGPYRFELHVKAHHTKPDPHGCTAEDQRLVGRRVHFVKAAMDGIARRKSQAIWKA